MTSESDDNDDPDNQQDDGSDDDDEVEELDAKGKSRVVAELLRNKRRK